MRSFVAFIWIYTIILMLSYHLYRGAPCDLLPSGSLFTSQHEWSISPAHSPQTVGLIMNFPPFPPPQVPRITLDCEQLYLDKTLYNPLKINAYLGQHVVSIFREKNKPRKEPA